MPQDPKPQRRIFRLRYVLAVALAAVLALYSGVWYHLSGRLASQAADAIAKENRNGKRVSCESLATGGFPLGLGIFCDSVLFEDDSAGFSLSTGRLESAMHIYAPLSVETKIVSPAHLEYPGLLPLDLKWKALASNIRLGTPLPANITVSATGLQASMDQLEASRPASLFTLESGKASLAPQHGDLDFTAALANLRTRIGQADASLNARADIVYVDGVAKVTSGTKDFRGTSIQIRNLSVSTSGGGTIALSGPLSIDDAGYLNGRISMEVEEAAALAADLAKIMPRAAEQIGSLIGLIAPPQNGGKGRMEIRIEKGRIYAGLFAVGEIPPIPATNQE